MQKQALPAQSVDGARDRDRYFDSLGVLPESSPASPRRGRRSLRQMFRQVWRLPLHHHARERVVRSSRRHGVLTIPAYFVQRRDVVQQFYFKKRLIGTRPGMTKDSQFQEVGKTQGRCYNDFFGNSNDCGK